MDNNRGQCVLFCHLLAADQFVCEMKGKSYAFLRFLFHSICNMHKEERVKFEEITTIPFIINSLELLCEVYFFVNFIPVLTNQIIIANLIDT